MAYDHHDTDLSGDQLKVVEYSILSVQPDLDDEKRILYGPKTTAVSSDMRPEDFATWVVALYIQSDKGREFPHNKKKYLRVCFRVTCRMTVEKDDEVDVLRDIQKTLKEGFATPRQAAEGGSGGSGGSGSNTPADRARRE